MGIRATSWAFQQRITPQEKLVLIALADHCIGTGNVAALTKASLSNWTGLSSPGLDTSLHTLESTFGLIRVAIPEGESPWMIQCVLHIGDEQ